MIFIFRLITRRKIRFQITFKFIATYITRFEESCESPTGLAKIFSIKDKGRGKKFTHCNYTTCYVLLRKYYCVKLFVHNMYKTIPKKNFHHNQHFQKK